MDLVFLGDDNNKKWQIPLTAAPSLHTMAHIVHRHLTCIPLGIPSADSTLLVCLFNTRSVSASRKRSEISTFIIDIMLLTWLPSCGLLVMRPR